MHCVCVVLILHLSPPFKCYVPGFHSGDREKQEYEFWPLCLSAKHGEKYDVFCVDFSDEKSLNLNVKHMRIQSSAYT